MSSRLDRIRALLGEAVLDAHDYRGDDAVAPRLTRAPGRNREELPVRA